MSEKHPSRELPYSSERARGILTPSDREFLLKQKTDYIEGSRIQKRKRIRRRLENAILDMAIIFEYLDERDTTNIFNPAEEHEQAYTESFESLIGFLYLGTLGFDFPFKEMLTIGINKSEQKLSNSEYRMVTVEFNVDPVGQIDLEEVVDKLEANEFTEITDEERRAVVRLLAKSENFSVAKIQPDLEKQLQDLIDGLADAAER